MELLAEYSEERHPGHTPGRFAGPGPEYDAMEFDGVRWKMRPQLGEGGEATSTALARLSQNDQALATRFEAEGGLALCLSSAFQVPDQLREEARRVLRNAGGGEEEAPVASEGEEEPELRGAAAVEHAMLLLQAADFAEDREAIMRNVWSDVEFNAGDLGNAELVNRLEMQFAGQLVNTAEAKLREKKKGGRSRQQDAAAEAAPEEAGEAEEQPRASAGDPSWAPNADDGKDGLFQVVLRDCQQANDLVERVPQQELTETLREPRNLGVALDLAGAYLKNYDIDKADMVLERILPLCRERGGPWLVKGLDKLCLTRMKQFRAGDALVCLKEIEQLAPFSPTEGWEFHDILYRNFAWCYSALDEAELCLEYTRKSAAVKRECGIPASWFDIWDIGKGHARLGQKTKQRKEMRVGYDLCRKAAEIHRTAEPGDRIMLAKILSNIGEVALGIGDSHYLDKEDDEALSWYEEAEEPLREAYELHSSCLGPMKPLTGWQAGTMSHCMVRLRRWEEAREYLALSLKVECTKDSTTPGSVAELVDRMMGIHQELADLPGLAAYAEDLEGGLAGLRARGWDRRERDVFALLLQKVSTLLLVADAGLAAQALKLLREAENSLQIHLQGMRADGTFECEAEEAVSEDAGPEADLDADADVAPKQFGPRADPEELLRQVRMNIEVLALGGDPGAGAGRFQEVGGGLGDRRGAPAGLGDSLREEEGGAGDAASEAPARRRGGGAGTAAAAEARRLERELQGLGLDIAALGSRAESDEVALARSYALVGSWTGWQSFDELARDPDGGSEFRLDVEVPPDKDVEFQVVCNQDWSQRMFPSLGGSTGGGAGAGKILGPSSGGHGLNWRLRRPLKAAPGRLLLRVTFDPTGGRTLRCELEAAG